MDLDFTLFSDWKGLSWYFSNHKEHRYAEWWDLLMYAMMPSYSPDDSFILMKAAIGNGWKFRAVYPMMNEKPTKNMIYVGSIMDGGLYIAARNQKSKREIVAWLTDHGFTKEM